MSLLANEFEKPARQIGVESFKRLVSDLRGFLISEVQTGYAEIEMGLGVAGFDTLSPGDDFLAGQRIDRRLV